MTEQDKLRYETLKAKNLLDDMEFAEFEVLQRIKENELVIAQFRKNQRDTYENKVSRAYNLAWEFYKKLDGQCYVAVGGLDSITLYVFLRSIGIDVPAISVSSLEDKSIQRVHAALGVQRLKSCKSKIEVIREFGWPVLSKEIAGKINLLQNPSEKNATVRHAIITGETGKQGGFRKGSRMKMSQKWLEKFGGYENETESVNYEKPDFFVSDKCCYYLKEKPCNDYQRESGRYPYMGLMASEGGRREKALMVNGCNYFGKTTKRSAPFATFLREDILRLALEMNEWYLTHKWVFAGDPVDSIIPEIYGDVTFDESGRLYTTKAQRTGCSMCGFGIHLEKRPHRFDLLWQRNPKEWALWMNHVMQREDGSWFGWGHVLDYIGVEWRDPEFVIENEQICIDLAASIPQLEGVSV